MTSMAEKTRHIIKGYEFLTCEGDYMHIEVSVSTAKKLFLEVFVSKENLTEMRERSCSWDAGTTHNKKCTRKACARIGCVVDCGENFNHLVHCCTKLQSSCDCDVSRARAYFIVPLDLTPSIAPPPLFSLLTCNPLTHFFLPFFRLSILTFL
jgi:hypothetical protein